MIKRNDPSHFEKVVAAFTIRIYTLHTYLSDIGRCSDHSSSTGAQHRFMYLKYSMIFIMCCPFDGCESHILCVCWVCNMKVCASFGCRVYAKCARWPIFSDTQQCRRNRRFSFISAFFIVFFHSNVHQTSSINKCSLRKYANMKNNTHLYGNRKRRHIVLDRRAYVPAQMGNNFTIYCYRNCRRRRSRNPFVSSDS